MEKPEATTPSQSHAYKAGVSQPKLLWHSESSPGAVCRHKDAQTYRECACVYWSQTDGLARKHALQRPREGQFCSSFYTFGIEGTLTGRWESRDRMVHTTVCSLAGGYTFEGPGEEDHFRLFTGVLT